MGTHHMHVQPAKYNKSDIERRNVVTSLRVCNRCLCVSVCMQREDEDVSLHFCAIPIGNDVLFVVWFER